MRTCAYFCIQGYACNVSLLRYSASTYNFWVLSPNVIQRLGIAFGVFDEDISYQLRLAVPLCKIGRLFVIPALPTHGNCGIEIEFQVSRRLDKVFQLFNIL